MSGVAGGFACSARTRRALTHTTLAGAVFTAAVPGLAAAQAPVRPPAPRVTRPPADTGRRPASAPSGRTGIGGSGGDTTWTITRARADTLRAGRADSARVDSAGADSAGTDSTGADSTRADSALVRWAEEDSTFTALRARPGYDAVRYQGDTVRFRARERVLTLRGAPAAVERSPTVLVGSAVRYDDSLQVVTALVDSSVAGDSVVLRDPTQGSDVVVRGGIRYDLVERRGVVSGFATSVTEGETWFVRGGRGAFATDSTLADSTGGGRIFYAHDGFVTSCNDSTPHYHFVARDIKVVARRLLVIRPAVLYIGNVPVMWLPFVFQDTRPGRRSGLLRPTFGVAELLRNSPSYQRSIRNVGYYTTLGDYADVKGWMDYRSGARPGPFGVGLLSFNAESRYKIIDRFVDGNLALAYDRQSDGRRNFRTSWQHSQAFNQDRRFNADINFVQNTQVQRRNLFDPNAANGTISSRANYQDKFGPITLGLGGSSRQTVGRPQRDVTFPQLNLTSRTITVAPWLDWTPTLSFDNQQSFRLDQATQFSAVYRQNANGGLDSTVLRQSSRNTSARFDTPLKIRNFNWQNSFTFSENVRNSPQTLQVIGLDTRDTTAIESRLFPQTFRSTFDWTTAFSLPSAFQGTWNLTPTVSIENVGDGGLFFRTERSGGRWVQGRKRPRVGVSAAPTLYAFLPGVGPVERFRHSVNPTFSYGYAPRADVTDEYLRATGNRRGSFLNAIQSNQFSLGFTTNLEAKLRGRAAARRPAPGDSAAGGVEANTAGGITTVVPVPGVPADARANAAGVVPASGGSANDEARKVRVLSMNFTGVSYDLALSDSLTGSYFSRRGLTTSTFGYDVRSDLLPGFQFRQDYNLFLGNPQSDTAQFSPFRTSTSVSFQLDRSSALLGTLARLFGRELAPAGQPSPTQGDPGLVPGGDPDFGRRAAAQRAAGSDPLDPALAGAAPRGFTLSVTYQSNRQRPDLRGTIIEFDPAQFCRPEQFITAFEYDLCLSNARANPTPGDTLNANNVVGGVIFRTPPQQTLQANSTFNITQKWSVQWSTTYDAVRRQFASNVVNLQRELHDWRANFGYTQSGNGNSLFSFFIALKAQPDLKFPFNRQTVRAPR